MRGEGALLWDTGQRPVSYRIDLYERGAVRSSSGDVRGDLSALVDEPPSHARLRLDGGREVEVTLLETEADVARIELVDAVAP